MSSRPPSSPSASRDGRVHRARVPPELPGRSHESGACRRQHHAPSDAVEQLGPQFSFQGSDPLGNQGLRDGQRGRGTADPAVLDDRQEVLDLPQLHSLNLAGDRSFRRWLRRDGPGLGQLADHAVAIAEPPQDFAGVLSHPRGTPASVTGQAASRYGRTGT